MRLALEALPPGDSCLGLVKRKGKSFVPIPGRIPDPISGAILWMASVGSPSPTAWDWQPSSAASCSACVASCLSAGPQGNKSLFSIIIIIFFRFVLCWINRLSQFIMCSNTRQWGGNHGELRARRGACWLVGVLQKGHRCPQRTRVMLSPLQGPERSLEKNHEICLESQRCRGKAVSSDWRLPGSASTGTACGVRHATRSPAVLSVRDSCVRRRSSWLNPPPCFVTDVCFDYCGLG